MIVSMIASLMGVNKVGSKI